MSIQNILVAFNAPSLVKFAPTVADNGVIIYDSSVIADPPQMDGNVQMYGVPFMGHPDLRHRWRAGSGLLRGHCHLS